MINDKILGLLTIGFLLSLASALLMPAMDSSCGMQHRVNPDNPAIVDIRCFGSCLGQDQCFMWSLGTLLDCVCGTWEEPYNLVDSPCNALGEIGPGGTVITCYSFGCSIPCVKSKRNENWQNICYCP